MPMLFGPLTACPRCKVAESFGRCLMTERGLLFRCKRCPHSECHTLPPIKKKIVYIDQFALSKMVKNADDRFWQELHARLHRLVSNDIATCPYSPIHVEESNYHVVLRDDLKKMYRSIAGTDCFKSPEEVQKLQLAKSLKAYLEGRKFGWSDLSPGDAFEENPHRWSDVFDVHVDFPYDDVLIGGLRQEKESLHERIKRLCDRWRANPPTFDQQAFAEANQYKQQITAYRHLTGGNPDRYPFNNSMLNVIDWLVRTVPTVCPDEKDPIGVLERFVETCTFERPHTSSCTVTRGQKLQRRLATQKAREIRRQAITMMRRFFRYTPRTAMQCSLMAVFEQSPWTAGSHAKSAMARKSSQSRFAIALLHILTS